MYHSVCASEFTVSSCAWVGADGFLLGGILLLYKFHSVLRYMLLIFYSFWVPQIVTSVIRDSRKPLHLYYILGMSATRLAVPLYVFGCPRNFMRIEPNYHWCAALVCLMGAQVTVLLLQHFFGPRCFIPRQVRPRRAAAVPLASCTPLPSTRQACGTLSAFSLACSRRDPLDVRRVSCFSSAP